MKVSTSDICLNNILIYLMVPDNIKQNTSSNFWSLSMIFYIDERASRKIFNCQMLSRF